MMEKDDFLNDDFLRELIRRSPLDSPSDDFVDRVMSQIQVTPEVSVVKKPMYFYLRTAIPYALVTLIFFFVISTSDLPLFNWLPGKNYFINNLLTYFGTMFTLLKSAFTSKYVSWILLISCSAGMLFFLDRQFSRRTSI
jgi:hypothetical protein